MSRSDTLGLDHFEQLYAARPDPWHYATSPYEAGNYAATLATLHVKRNCCVLASRPYTSKPSLLLRG